MVRTESAIVGTSEFGSGNRLRRIFRRLVVVPKSLVVLNVRGNQDVAEAMLRTAFPHEDVPILKDNLGVNFPQTFRAETESEIVVGVVPSFRHGDVQKVLIEI